MRRMRKREEEWECGSSCHQTYLVAQQLAVWAHHPEQLDLPDAQRIAAALPVAPCEIVAGKLPEPIEAEAAGHDRVAREVALKEPEVRRDVELRHNMSLAMKSPVLRRLEDAAHHEHRWSGKACVVDAEDLARSNLQKALAVPARGVLILHLLLNLHHRASRTQRQRRR